MELDSSWIYMLVFLAFPLARIIPRMLRKRRMKTKTQENISQRTIQEKSQFQTDNDDKYLKDSQMKSSSSSNLSAKNMLVLGELIKGSTTFGSIQKNTGLGNKELDSILEDLEKNEMLKAHQKKGIAGTKIQIHPTDKGFDEYYS